MQPGGCMSDDIIPPRAWTQPPSGAKARVITGCAAQLKVAPFPKAAYGIGSSLNSQVRLTAQFRTPHSSIDDLRPMTFARAVTRCRQTLDNQMTPGLHPASGLCV